MSEIDEKAEASRKNPAIVLLDVREASEYASGHIPGAISHPLSRISTVSVDVPDRNAEIYVYCQSGSRAMRAADLMKQHGYTRVETIGGMEDYHGPLEK